MAKSGQSSKSPDCICLIISVIRLGDVLDIVKVLKFALLRYDTFPRGRLGHRLHRPLLPHSSFPPLGKVPGISAKTVHFPPWPAGTPAPQAPLAPLGISTSRGKCREFPRKRFTFPRGRQGHWLHMPISQHSSFLPPGKVPGISAKTVHFPPQHETSEEVQQGLLGEVLSIQAL